MEKKKKVYLSRCPKVGDLVEAKLHPSDKWDNVEHEYSVIGVYLGFIAATGEGLSPHKNKILIPDGRYNIVEYIVELEPDETHVKTYKFLGIPIMKRVVHVYK